MPEPGSCSMWGALEHGRAWAQGPSCSQGWKEFRSRERILNDLTLLPTFSLSEDKADVSSYLQSFFLFPAKRPLLLGERLAASPAEGLPRRSSITGNTSLLPLRGQRGSVPRAIPMGLEVLGAPPPPGPERGTWPWSPRFWSWVCSCHQKGTWGLPPGLSHGEAEI